jgi:4-hydroxy 2-oxovalerate aldolase
MIPQVLDVTLRDGGYVNGWDFSTSDAIRIVSTLTKAGVPRIEVGYYRPRLTARASGLPGPMCCCSDYLKALSKVRSKSSLTVMAHLSDIGEDDYKFLTDHGISFVRFVIPTQTIPPIEAHINAAHKAGLGCSINLIRLSERSLELIISSARRAEAMGADWLYTADSNGSMFPEQVALIFQELVREVRIPIGFHAHDSLRLAFANSLAALKMGGHMLDSSLGGMGKGAGNLVTELITSYFKRNYNAQFDVAQLTAITCETLSAWISSDHHARCENALSALLDLNADDLKNVIHTAETTRRPLLLELEQQLNELVRHGEKKRKEAYQLKAPALPPNAAL